MNFNMLEYVCDYCGRSFTRKYNLRIHIENCHLTGLTVCQICHQSFGSPSGLLQHMSRGHNSKQEGYPECDVCGRIFKRKQNIVSHMVTIHLQGTENRCTICYKNFTTSRNLKRHIYHLHNPDFEYLECDDCNKIFKGKNSLITHIQAIHNSAERFAAQCHLCDKTYTNKRNLKRHIENQHGEKGEFHCGHCPKVYTTKQSLRRHTKIWHSPITAKTLKKVLEARRNDPEYQHFQRKTYHCSACSAIFDKEPLLRMHIKTEHSFDTFYEYCRTKLLKKKFPKQKGTGLFYNCEFCSCIYSNVYDLKEHMRLGHNVAYCLSTCNVCFSKFYSKETASKHKTKCFPPPNANPCSFCDKLFTDVSSLEFHTRIFHPQITDCDVTSTDPDHVDSNSVFKCPHCRRVYYSDRSLKHHMKLKHTNEEATECELCGKICNNKYYLASHMKIVHCDHNWSKCDYCDKQFKSKRNIRRHIEYTHMGMQRYKCIECETLFKEKRSLRKHVRTKHADSKLFPQCHICKKRFESAKSCKIHLKLVHSFNLNTHPCHLCSISFTSYESLKTHLQTSHLAEDEIYKCEECNLVFKGQETFEQHNESHHVNLVSNIKQKVLPRCILCMKDFSTRKTLKRHIKKFHPEFEADELATFGSRKRSFNVDCEQCIKKFTNDQCYNIYQKVKHKKDSIVFTCSNCSTTYYPLEYAIQRYRQMNSDGPSKMYLSELCTAEMSDGEDVRTDIGSVNEVVSMEPESTTNDIKEELFDISDSDIKTEPPSP